MTIQLYPLSKNTNFTINLLSQVNRPGIDELITYLLNSNFFDSPASTKYHNNFYGGLNQHCINVYNLFIPRNRALDEPIPKDSEIIVSLCHDLCKVGYYYFNGDKWKSNKQHQMNSLHGVLSVQILKQFIELTPVEEAIIKYHMGLFSVYGYVKEYSAEELHEAISKYVAVQVFASCDNEDAHTKNVNRVNQELKKNHIPTKDKQCIPGIFDGFDTVYIDDIGHFSGIQSVQYPTPIKLPFINTPLGKHYFTDYDPLVKTVRLRTLWDNQED